MAGGHGGARAGAGRKSKGARPDSVAYAPSVQDATGKFAIKSKGVGLGNGVHGFFKKFQHFEKPKIVDSDLDANSSLATLSHGAYQSTSWIFRHHDKQSPNIASIAVPATFDARIIGIIEVTRRWIYGFYWLEKKEGSRRSAAVLVLKHRVLL